VKIGQSAKPIINPTEKVVHHLVILLTDVVKTQKNHTTLTDLNCINFIYPILLLYFSTIAYWSLSIFPKLYGQIREFIFRNVKYLRWCHTLPSTFTPQGAFLLPYCSKSKIFIETLSSTYDSGQRYSQRRIKLTWKDLQTKLLHQNDLKKEGCSLIKNCKCENRPE